MLRISGVQIPEERRIEVALTYIYGIGRHNVRDILKQAKVEAFKRAKDLSTQEIASLQKAMERIPTEGVLRKIVTSNIKRLKQIGTYRGARHAAGLPVRGQRTRTNARAKRGKRKTVGALKKEALQKIEKTKTGKGEIEKK